MSKITIDELAVMVQKGFSHLDAKIEAVRAELKQDIQDVRTELKQEIQDVRTELKQEIQDVKTELKQDIHSVRADIRRLESILNEVKERLTRLEKRSFEDDEVLAKEVVDLRKRVDFLEKQFKKLNFA